MSQPGRIHLTVPQTAGEPKRLSVQVRDTDLMLQASGPSDRPLQVEPGQYVVSVTLPDGRELTVGRIVEVGANVDVTVELPIATTARAESGRRSLSRDAASWDAASAYRTRFESLSVEQLEAVESIGSDPLTPPDQPQAETEEVAARPKIWQGNWLSAWRAAKLENWPSLARGTISAGEEAGDSLLIQGKIKRDTLLVLPSSGDRFDIYSIPFAGSPESHPPPVTLVRLFYAGIHRGELELAFRDDPDTSAFLAYVQLGLAREARSLSADLVARGETAMMVGPSWPLRAALGGYVLLRANELEGMDSWTAQLLAAAPWLPDALPLRVEYLARTGRHDEAADLLASLDGALCPWFRSGVSYLLERLKLYVAVYEEKRRSFLVSDSRAVIYRDALRCLSRLSVWLDPSNTLCTWRNLPIWESQNLDSHLP